jgi:hypothetical protein
MAMTRNLKHKQVHLQWNDWESDVDEGIAPLILELWKAGILTSLSCEENRRELMWIMFPDAFCAQDFLNIVAKYEEDSESLYQRIKNGWTRHRKDDAPGTWEYDVGIDDYSVELIVDDEENIAEEVCTGPADFVFGLSVRFPKTDYPVLLERMRKFNQKKRRKEAKAEASKKKAK